MIEGCDGALVDCMDITQGIFADAWASLIRDRFDASHPGASIVDVGCGSGLLLQALARNGGFELTGLDSSEEMIGRSSLRLEGRARLVRADVARDDAPLYGTDLVVCVSGVANCIAAEDGLGTALVNMHRMTRTGGALWVELYTLDYLRGLAEQMVVQETKEFSLIVRAIWLDRSQELLLRLSGAVNKGDHRQPFDNLIRYRFVGSEELLQLAFRAGLSQGRTVDGAAGHDRVCWEFIAT